MRRSKRGFLLFVDLRFLIVDLIPWCWVVWSPKRNTYRYTMPVLVPPAPSAISPNLLTVGGPSFISYLFAVSKQPPPRPLSSSSPIHRLPIIPMTKHTGKDRGTAALLGSTRLGGRMDCSFTLAFHRRDEKERACEVYVCVYEAGLPSVSWMVWYGGSSAPPS